jgi:hypothetical protein
VCKGSGLFVFASEVHEVRSCHALLVLLSVVDEQATKRPGKMAALWCARLLCFFILVVLAPNRSNSKAPHYTTLSL